MPLPEILTIVAQGLWFVAPAWAANAFPPLTGGRLPLDRKATFRGQRLFGNSKTIEGTLGGLMFGSFIGWLLMLSKPLFPVDIWQQLGLFEMTPMIIISIVIGALVGDLVGSAIKRRLNLKPGTNFWPFDQLGFIIFAMLFAAPMLMLQPTTVIFIVSITLFVHWFGNQIGYAMRVKKVPW